MKRICARLCLAIMSGVASPSSSQTPSLSKEVRALGASKTLLVSTHILQEVEAIADRVLLIDGGRLVFDGSPAELAEDGSLEGPFYRLTTH